MKNERTNWKWILVGMIALLFGMNGTFSFADDDDDEYLITNGVIRVEYDAEDGDLDIKHIAEMKVFAQGVTQTPNELTLTGIAIAPGVTATLHVKLEANSPWVQFTWNYNIAGDVSQLTNVQVLRMELSDNHDRWEAPFMNIANTKAGEQNLLTVAAKTDNAGFVAGWKTGAGTVTATAMRKDIYVSVSENLTASPKTNTFKIGKFVTNVQDGVSAF